MKTLILTDHPENDLRVRHSQKYLDSITLQVPRWFGRKFHIFPGYPFLIYLLTFLYKFDTIYCHDLSMALAGIKRNKKVIVDLHEDFYDCYNYSNFKYPFLKWFVREKRMVRLIDKVKAKADYLITVSEGLMHKYGADNYYPNVQDPTPIERHQSDIPIIVYLGGMGPGRGLDDLRDAVPKIKYPCVIALIGDNAPVIEDTDNVTCIILKNDSEYVSSFLEMADIGLLPNIDCPQNKYCSPNKLWLYMNYGMAVLSRYWLSNVGNVLTKYKCGYFVIDLADGLNIMVSQPEWIKQRGLSGRKAVEESYNAETLIKPVFEIVKNKII